MLMPAAWSLQIGVYNHLRSSTDLQAYIGSPARLYDAVPPDAVFPFLTLGETRVRDLDGVEGAAEHDVRIHAWSRWGGRKEAKELADLVFTHLHDADFPVADQAVVQCRFVFADIFRQPDPDTYHAAMRYRIVTEPTA